MEGNARDHGRRGEAVEPLSDRVRMRTAPAGQLLVHLMACSILWSFERKLQIKPGRRVAVVNAPPGSVLTTMFGEFEPARADAVIGFVA
jgi:hypothetical protein